MDLLKPLLGAERTIDALGHYHGRTSQTVRRNQLHIPSAHFFSHLQQYSGSVSEIITNKENHQILMILEVQNAKIFRAPSARRPPHAFSELRHSQIQFFAPAALKNYLGRV